MAEKSGIKIIAFVGLAGTGKSEAVSYLSSKGYPRVYFGGVILDAMSEAGIEHTEANEKQFREEIREREGKDFVVRRIISQIRGLVDAGQRLIIADGLYTWTEYRALKHEFPGELDVIAIVASRPVRNRRLAVRPIRPLSAEEVTARDWAEIENLEKGGPIAIADHFIINDSSIEALQKKIDDILGDDKIFAE